jgi:hypothetical protein
MIIPIKTDANITADEMDVTETSFKSLNLKESHIEEFIRTNIVEISKNKTAEVGTEGATGFLLTMNC